MRLSKPSVLFIIVLSSAPIAATALDVDDFSCTFDQFMEGTFRKQGGTAVLATKDEISGDLSVEKFQCDFGVSARYSDALLCTKEKLYEGVARSSVHLVFLNDFRQAIMTRSSYSPTGERMGFGTGAHVIASTCQ